MRPYIDQNNPLALMWNTTGRSTAELENIVTQIVQEEVIHHFFPSQYEISTWKASGKGKELLKNYLLDKAHITLTQEGLSALWRYYTNTCIKKRNNNLTSQFRKLNSPAFCNNCGITTGIIHVDHKIPLALGGEDKLSNLQYLCEKCNKKKWRFSEVILLKTK